MEFTNLNGTTGLKFQVTIGGITGTVGYREKAILEFLEMHVNEPLKVVTILKQFPGATYPNILTCVHSLVRKFAPYVVFRRGKVIFVPRRKASVYVRAFFQLELQQRDAMGFLRQFGFLKGGVLRLDLGMLQGEQRSYRNIAFHMIIVGMAADILLERAVECGVIPEPVRKLGTKWAILHDLLKRQELEIEYGMVLGGGIFLDPLRKRNVCEEILSKALPFKDFQEFSLSSLAGDGANWLEDINIEIDETYESFIRWVIFLCDYMVAHDRLVSPEERIREAINRNTYNKLFSWWYVRFFGEDSLKEVRDLPNGNLLIAERQYEKIRGYLRQVEDQLHVLLGVPSEVSIVDFVKIRLVERSGSGT